LIERRIWLAEAALLLLMVKGLRAASGGSRHVCNGSWGGLAGDFSS